MERRALAGVAPAAWPSPRRADRREGLHRLVRELTFEMVARRDRQGLADRLVERLGDALPVR
ncbi:MAG: hypothetical protein AB7N90_18560 [Vicinamibacterales bacterium]